MKHGHLEHFIDNTNNPPIQKTDKSKVYSCIFIIDRGYRPKYMASKHLCPKYYIVMYMWMAHTINMPCATFLQLLLNKRLTIC